MSSVNYKTLEELGLELPLAFYNVNQLDSYAVFSQTETEMLVSKSRAFIDGDRTIMKYKKPVTRKIQSDSTGVKYVKLDTKNCALEGFKRV